MRRGRCSQVTTCTRIPLWVGSSGRMPRSQTRWSPGATRPRCAGPVDGEGEGVLDVVDLGGDQRGDAPVEGHRPGGRGRRRPGRGWGWRSATSRRPGPSGPSGSPRPAGAASRRRQARLAASTIASVIGVTRPDARRSAAARAAGRGLGAALGEVGLGLADDPAHRLDRLDRVLADGRLAREHHGVGAVEHGVEDVGRLGAGRAVRGLHAVEHLRRGDHRDPRPVAGGDDPLLDRRAPAPRPSRRPGRRGPPSRRRLAAMIASRSSTACGFSILATIRARQPRARQLVAEPDDVGRPADEREADVLDVVRGPSSRGRRGPCRSGPRAFRSAPGRLIPCFDRSRPAERDRPAGPGPARRRRRPSPPRRRRTGRRRRP